MAYLAKYQYQLFGSAADNILSGTNENTDSKANYQFQETEK